ncbi:MAG: helix-turn-helix domain-containing protein [Nitrososphaeria archaeon]|jgi:hypothetical protein
MTVIPVALHKGKSGRKPIYTKNFSYIDQLKKLYNEGKKPSEISKILNVSTPTIYRWLKELGLLEDRNKNIQIYSVHLELNGFVKVDKNSTAKRLLKMYPDARIVKINTGVGMEGRRFSSVSFFGNRPYTLTFIVKDDQAFKEHVARFLEGIFYEKNPNPDPNLKKAFTHFIHSFGLNRIFQESPFRKVEF